jgi:hypothetical protein
VGSFVVHGEASTTSVAVGEALVWKIIIEGSGNLHSFAPPKLERQLNGFHSRGRIENLHADRREFVYELVPLHELDGLPAIAFSFFDPVRERYETVRTAPIALTVGPGSGAVVLPQPQALPVEVEKKPASVPEKLPEAPVERADIGPLKALAAPSQALNRERLSSTQLMGFLSAPWILWLGSSVWRRRQQRRRISLAERRARGAAAAFRAQVAGGSTPLCAAYAEFIGARLHCPSATVIGPGLVERLRHADVPLELASECAAALGKLVDERFGGRADATGVERIAGLVDRLEALFAQPEATSA